MSGRTELTRRGWALLGAATGLLLAGRLLGALELTVLAVVTGVLLGAAAVWTRGRQIELSLERSVRPTRLRVGGDGRVDLVVVGQGSASTPALAATEDFDRGRRAARFVVPPLVSGQQARAAYRLPTARRGRFDIGPLRITVEDPFGLVSRTSTLGTTDQVIVAPRVHDVLAPDPAGGRTTGPTPAVRRPSPTVESDEFLTLRSYEPGDDLRHVHWRSTARLDELMVRQRESWWRPRTTVVLDTRAGAHDELSFERAVEAAASILVRVVRRGDPVELVTATGASLGGPRASEGLLLDQLAVVTATDPDQLLDVLRARRRTRPAGPRIVILGRSSPDELGALVRIATPAAPVTVVVTRDPNAEAVPVSFASRSLDVVVVDATSRSFPQAWNEAMTRRGARHSARARTSGGAR